MNQSSEETNTTNQEILLCKRSKDSDNDISQPFEYSKELQTNEQVNTASIKMDEKKKKIKQARKDVILSDVDPRDSKKSDEQIRKPPLFIEDEKKRNSIIKSRTETINNNMLAYTIFNETQVYAFQFDKETRILKKTIIYNNGKGEIREEGKPGVTEMTYTPPKDKEKKTTTCSKDQGEITEEGKPGVTEMTYTPPKDEEKKTTTCSKDQGEIREEGISHVTKMTYKPPEDEEKKTNSDSEPRISNTDFLNYNDYENEYEYEYGPQIYDITKDNLTPGQDSSYLDDPTIELNNCSNSSETFRNGQNVEKNNDEEFDEAYSNMIINSRSPSETDTIINMMGISRLSSPYRHNYSYHNISPYSLTPSWGNSRLSSPFRYYGSKYDDQIS